MTEIIIDSDGSKIVGNIDDPEVALRAHGYDPAETNYVVNDPEAELQSAINNASNLQELKDALTANSHRAHARDRR